MEVRSIGQGGQASFDNTSTKIEKPITAESVSQPQPVNQKAATENQQPFEESNKKNTVNEKELKDALEKLSKFIEDDNTKIEYEYHKKFNDLMIKIINKDTKQVILEVPPKKILDLVARMVEMVGVLFDKKA